MGKTYLATAFSLAMVKDLPAVITVSEISPLRVPEDYINAVGHESTAKVLSKILGKEITANRINIELRPGDEVIVFQLLKRPKEGQVYTEQEVEEIVRQELYRFIRVKVLGEGSTATVTPRGIMALEAEA